MRAHTGQVALSAGITALGVLIVAGSFFLPEGGGYAQVGPSLVPRVVGAGLILLGALLIKESLTGGFDGVDEEAEAKLPIDWPAFAWVTAGLLANAALITTIGFILSCTLCYLLAVQGLRRAQGQPANAGTIGVDALTGALISAPVYWAFTKFLAINLPGLTGSGWI